MRAGGKARHLYLAPRELRMSDDYTGKVPKLLTTNLL